MTIDEMKNKISMELRSKDTQLGFEVICKKLTELEKENKQLKVPIEKIKCCSTCSYYTYCGIDREITGHKAQIKKLEKENAELKSKLNEYVNIVEDDEVKCDKLQKKIKGLEEQIESLTKENDVLIKGLGCETCSITGEYLKLNNTIRELEEENAELKKEIEKRSMYEKHIEYENEQLKEQIEKMKNCMNCDNGIVDDEDICDDCNSENCWKNWELAE